MNKTRRTRISALFIVITAVLACFALTSCNPVLSLNSRYSYTSFDLELGETVPADIAEYVDFSELSDEDAAFVRDNTEILYDGEPAEGRVFDDAGTHTLTINYAGHQYRKYDITITDKEPPEFTRAKNIYTFVGLSIDESRIPDMFKAKDNSGKVDISISDASPDYSTAGKYKVTAVATDPSGNTTEEDAYIVVQAPEYGAKGTYVFVSISNQQVTYFVDGEVVLTCPVVTGNPYDDHATPTGTYTLNYKSRNTKLVGRENNGDEYESFVNYWMAFIGASVGLHDATWRSSFGGTIYKGGGSHGCVNMPYWAAAELYEMITPGTPILVY